MAGLGWRDGNIGPTLARFHACLNGTQTDGTNVSRYALPISMDLDLRVAFCETSSLGGAGVGIQIALKR